MNKTCIQAIASIIFIFVIGGMVFPFFIKSDIVRKCEYDKNVVVLSVDEGQTDNPRILYAMKQKPELVPLLSTIKAYSVLLEIDGEIIELNTKDAYDYFKKYVSEETKVNILNTYYKGELVNREIRFPK